MIPGVKGLSDNIRVLSIVDRFLEHSRIFYFGDADRLYLSSADWMPRNFFSRLEIAFPILDDALRQFIRDVVIPIYRADTVKARELTPQGTWRKRSSGSGDPLQKKLGLPSPVRAQFCFQELARREYKNTPLCRDRRGSLS